MQSHRGISHEKAIFLPLTDQVFTVETHLRTSSFHLQSLLFQATYAEYFSTPAALKNSDLRFFLVENVKFSGTILFSQIDGVGMKICKTH